jgi:hypothetical protein
MTVLRRLLLLAVVFLVWVPAAYGWSWPVQGPVLQAFVYDEAHPYASEQHRGIDIGADAASDPVVAPSGGTITFAGTVPTSGECVTIETSDGYSVTLTHLGSVLVARGAEVTEGDVVGTVGPSGTPEVPGPYVHLGIRVTADENGYVDPLAFLPAVDPPVAPADPGDQGDPPAASGAPPQSSPAASPAPSPAANVEPTAVSSGEQPTTRHGSQPAARHGSQPVRGRRAPSHHAPVRSASEDLAAARDRRVRGDHSRAPVTGTHDPRSQPRARGDVAAGQTGAALPPPRRLVPVLSPLQALTRALRRRSEPQPEPVPVQPLLPVVLNGLAALFALTAVLTVRRRAAGTDSIRGGQILHLSPPESEQGRERDAA